MPKRLLSSRASRFAARSAQILKRRRSGYVASRAGGSGRRPPASARRERVLRSYSLAAAPTRGCSGRHLPGALMRRMCSVLRGSQGGKSARGIAPHAFRLRSDAACSNVVRHPGPPSRERHRLNALGLRRSGCGRIGPTLSRAINEETKTVPKRSRRRGDQLAVDPDSGCRSDDPSRRRIVRTAAEGPFFRAAKREA
jgi:hypothetical protein